MIPIALEDLFEDEWDAFVAMREWKVGQALKAAFRWVVRNARRYNLIRCPGGSVAGSRKRARAAELGFNDPCVICHNRTLCEIVRTLPISTTELLAVWGIGKKRCDQHGVGMLAALAPFRSELAKRAATIAGVRLARAGGDGTDHDAEPNSGALCNSAPATDWLVQHRRGDLPGGAWANRRGCVYLLRLPARSPFRSKECAVS